ncbi:anti-sigma factor [Hyphomicrobium sp.]|uniref:anti-sigma factor family protein n=1 Tax=Hyphomicrobium sp. TaxID=82 RepID=UPI001D1C6DB8|nr:anti-sigma factor [Hyphomicrobium sp.]MBY0561632.1 anti-sigma factor [Hyphomicrobium sp.]
MIKPSSWSSREESLILLNAYLDDELDAASALDVERRLAADPALRAERDRIAELRSTLVSHLSAQRASDDFKRRIAGIADPSRDVVVALPSRQSRSYDWRQMAAAAVVAAAITAGGMYGVLRQNSGANEIAAIVADHQRALLAAQPFDIASSDRHTVKPWFDSKIAISPQVVDLAGAGFPLAGGRVEIVDGKPVPVLVYQRRAHVISVVAVPRAGQMTSTAPALQTTKDGYSVIRWFGRDFEYFAVSDVPEPELREFVSRWREATPGS